MRRHVRGGRWGALFVLLGLTAVCASTASAGQRGLVHPAQTAAKAPILLGNLSTVKNPAVSAGEMVDGTVAWANYLNKTYHGVNGHLIKIITCDDQGNASLSIQCANNLLGQGVVGFVGGWSITFGANALATVEQAKVPIFGGWPITNQEYTSPVEFPVTPGAAGSYPALAIALRAAGAKTLTGLFYNIPASIPNSDAVAALWPAIGGTNYSPVYYPPTAADLTPVAASATSSHPDAIFLGTAAAAATRLITAVRAVGFSGTMGMTGLGASHDVYVATGDKLLGTYFTLPGANISNTKVKDVRLYLQVMGKAHVPAGALSLVAASGMQYAFDVLKSIKGNITRASVLAAANKMTSWPGFLTHPMSPKWAPPGYSSVRNPFNTIVKYVGKGKTVQVKISGFKKYIDTYNGIQYVSGFPVVK